MSRSCLAEGGYGGCIYYAVDIMVQFVVGFVWNFLQPRIVQHVERVVCEYQPGVCRVKCFPDDAYFSVFATIGETGTSVAASLFCLQNTTS